MKTGIELISEERGEHFTKHRISIGLDKIYNSEYQLCTGAARLLFSPIDEGFDMVKEADIFIPEMWDKELWVKMCSKTYKDRLIIAGALIAAEIDRISNQ